MSIRFYPLGIPISSSFTISSSAALTSSLGGLPHTGSLASYSVLAPQGPQGPPFVTVNASFP